MPILKEKQQISRYTVRSLIKERQYNESYCVQDVSGVSYFLKIYGEIRSLNAVNVLLVLCG